MAMLEKAVEGKLKGMVEEHGGLCLKWVCPGWAGVPDRIIILTGGLVMFAETKRPKGGKVSKLQEWWAKRLRARGFSVFFVFNDKDIETVEQAILYARPEATCGDCEWWHNAPNCMDKDLYHKPVCEDFEPVYYDEE